MSEHKAVLVKTGLVLVVCVLWHAWSIAANVPVTFNVNMSIQKAMGNFDPDGRGDTVLVAGNWDSWATTNTMSPSSQPDVYTLTLDLAEGSWPNYKFVINPYGSSSGPNLRWESGDNRWFQVPPGGTNLPVVYFNDATSAVVVANITFQIDMSVQMALGNFNPDEDLVFVAGDWDWRALVTGPFQRSAENTNIWSFAHPQTNSIGALVNYKFIIYRPGTGTTVWEADGVGPGGARNRQFNFPAGDTNLPVVFFNNVSNITVVAVSPVTFAVNLAVQDAYGNFTPGLDTVSVAGEFNDWNAATWQLTPTETNEDLFVGTFNVTNVVGATVNYKFVLNNGVRWERDGLGPGGAQNRQFTFTNQPIALPMVFFDGTNDLGSINIESVETNHITLNWLAGPKVRLQSSPDLNSWDDVPGSQGEASATLPMTNAHRFFRLIGP